MGWALFSDAVWVVARVRNCALWAVLRITVQIADIHP